MAKEIADALNVSRANITNMLAMLIQKNLLLQYEDKEDRRRKRLRLTEKGINLLSKFEEVRAVYNNKLFDGISKEEKDNFMSFIKRCLMVMNTKK
jgi:DNA-binding MarR family transcriptional regulator